MEKLEKVDSEENEKGIWQDEWVPTTCQLCVEGPDLIRVHVVNGVAINVEGNREVPGYEKWSTNQGRICPRPFSLLQKIYNPYRIKTPLKRTNPEKGRGIYPKWVEISWDEALDIVAEKMKDIRARNPGLLAANVESVATSKLEWRGDMGPFFHVYGPITKLRSGASGRCDQGEHMMANIIHGGYQCEPDLRYCNYMINFGANYAASGGVPENIPFADAHERGMREVAIDPVLTPTAAKANEWIPIRPGTDTAFTLALINVIIHEIGVLDIEFLKTMTNSPYLVGNDGYWLRDKATGKVLMWDMADSKVKTYDDDSLKDPALEGEYVVDGAEGKPSFQLLKEHVKQYTPEWAAPVTDIPASTTRRMAREWVDNARIGSTITIDGINFPYRPVGTKCGRVDTGSKGCYQHTLAVHILAILVGCIEVPGGHGGGRGSYEEPLNRGIASGPDGMPSFEAYDFVWPPIQLDAAETFCPYTKMYGRTQQLAYINLADPPKDVPVPPTPEMWFRFRVNPLLALGQHDIVEKALKKIPFIISISCVHDEITELADIVLPEPSDFERYEPLLDWVKAPVGDKKRGWYLCQPAVKPLYDTRDHMYIFTELASRLGFLAEFNETVSMWSGLTDHYKLEPDRKYTLEELVDLQCKSATNGEHDLEWFKKNGAILKPVPVDWQYGVHLAMKEKKLRYPLPYMEHVLKTGRELGENLAKVGIDWWQTSEYTPLPTYERWITEETSPEYDFYVTTCRFTDYALGYNVDCPWLIEQATYTPGRDTISMNAIAAAERGIEYGDEIWVESEVGKVKRKVKLTQGIRPDTLLIPGQFGQWAVPIAKDTGRVTQSTLLPLRYSWTDPVTGSQMTLVKAKVYKA
ncbi:molybdopterin-dependent oxidoreductase [Chloroflexota bacterium]